LEKSKGFRQKSGYVTSVPDSRKVSLKDQSELVETYATDFFNWFFGPLTRPFSVEPKFNPTKGTYSFSFSAP
jgi:hypothetical protein